MKIMKISLFAVSVLLIICGALMISTADGSTQELESLMVILIASVLMVGACIIHAIGSLRKSIEDRS
jgi:drug/metabolite transporter (DMT)-like permease